jgi:hypothetical protein
MRTRARIVIPLCAFLLVLGSPSILSAQEDHSGSVGAAGVGLLGVGAAGFTFSGIILVDYMSLQIPGAEVDYKFVKVVTIAGMAAGAIGGVIDSRIGYGAGLGGLGGAGLGALCAVTIANRVCALLPLLGVIGGASAPFDQEEEQSEPQLTTTIPLSLLF